MMKEIMCDRNDDKEWRFRINSYYNWGFLQFKVPCSLELYLLHLCSRRQFLNK